MGGISGDTLALQGLRQVLWSPFQGTRGEQVVSTGTLE